MNMAGDMFPRKHNRQLEDDYEYDMEMSIKKLKVNSTYHVDVPCPKPMSKRLPHIRSSDDVNFSEVNKVLKELALMREFRAKLRTMKHQHLVPIPEDRELIYVSKDEDGIDHDGVSAMDEEASH
mmetsp:Transcript_3934/g.6167  ORF Transcript_3934/g.6167 Transcript_3934/m.6167 type:complete len:124 (+) Transcript_3934:60-431(+)